jgi:hypothetical protein
MLEEQLRRFDFISHVCGIVRPLNACASARKLFEK